MALKTVANLRDSVSGMLSGLDLNNVFDLNGCFERAISTQIQKADIPEASNTQNINLYSGVYNYSCNSRVFGTEIKDIRPQGISRNPWDYVYKKPSETFDRLKGYLDNGTMATFEYSNGLPIIRIVSKIPVPENVIDSMDSTTGWTAAGSASGLTLDSSVYYQSPSSLRFLLTGASTGTLTKTLSSTLDLSSYEDVGVAFLAIRIPDNSTATDITSIQLKLGSDSTNYNNVSSTTGFLGSWTSGNWLLVSFDFSGASQTGTPDWSAIDYIQISITTLTTQTNFRVGGLWISQPSPHQIFFQSAAIFIPSGSTTAQTTITATTDTITLNDPAYNIYLHESALEVLGNTSGGGGDSMRESTEKKLLELYARFRAKNPSESLNNIDNYYEE